MSDLCDGKWHYKACPDDSPETCQNGPTWHWTIGGEGGHCVSKCEGKETCSVVTADG